jgi:hypothetical protein
MLMRAVAMGRMIVLSSTSAAIFVTGLTMPHRRRLLDHNLDLRDARVLEGQRHRDHFAFLQGLGDTHEHRDVGVVPASVHHRDRFTAVLAGSRRPEGKIVGEGPEAVVELVRLLKE